MKFIVPELPLVTHLLRPGPLGAMAAVELVLAREKRGGIELDVARRWGMQLGYEMRLQAVLTHAEALKRV